MCLGVPSKDDIPWKFYRGRLRYELQNDTIFIPDQRIVVNMCFSNKI